MSEPKWLEQASNNLSAHVNLVLESLRVICDKWEVTTPDIANIIGAKTTNTDGWVGTLVLTTSFDVVCTVAGGKKQTVVSAVFTVDSSVNDVVSWMDKTGEWVRNQ